MKHPKTPSPIKAGASKKPGTSSTKNVASCKSK